MFFIKTHKLSIFLIQKIIQYFLHTEDRYSSRPALMRLNFLLRLGSLSLLRKRKFYVPQTKISFIFSSKWFLNWFIFFCNMHLSWLYTETLMHHIYGLLLLKTVHTILHVYTQNAITVKTNFFLVFQRKTPDLKYNKSSPGTFYSLFPVIPIKSGKETCLWSRAQYSSVVSKSLLAGFQ